MQKNKKIRISDAARIIFFPFLLLILMITLVILNKLFPDYDIYKWFDAILFFLSSISWQIVIVIVTLIFRSPLLMILDRGFKLRYKDVDLDIRKINMTMNSIEGEFKTVSNINSGSQQSVLKSSLSEIYLRTGDEIVLSAAIDGIFQKVQNNIAVTMLNDKRFSEWNKEWNNSEFSLIELYINKCDPRVLNVYKELEDIRNQISHHRITSNERYKKNNRFDVAKFEGIAHGLANRIRIASEKYMKEKLEVGFQSLS